MKEKRISRRHATNDVKTRSCPLREQVDVARQRLRLPFHLAAAKWHEVVSIIVPTASIIVVDPLDAAVGADEEVTADVRGEWGGRELARVGRSCEVRKTIPCIEGAVVDCFSDEVKEKIVHLVERVAMR